MRILLVLGLFKSIASWSQTTAKKQPVTIKNVPPKTVFTLSKEDIELGKQLTSKSDCNTCHQLDGTLIGPGHRDVAKKYDVTLASVNYLANKIKLGGSGVWGDAEMEAHPDLTVEDTKKIAKYILSLRP